MKILDIIEYTFLSFGIVLAVADVREVLAIILLIIDSLWLILKLVIKIFRYLKDGELTEEELEDLENEVKEGRK